jgi:hypothetical protein
MGLSMQEKKALTREISKRYQVLRTASFLNNTPYLVFSVGHGTLAKFGNSYLCMSTTL